MNDLQPARTMFLEISIPNELAPDKKMLDVACLATASIPIAPMYHDHLSFTSSFSISISLIFPSSSSSVKTSTSSKVSFPSLIS
jgi:hypothetical protein